MTSLVIGLLLLAALFGAAIEFTYYFWYFKVFLAALMKNLDSLAQF
jgi:hypothetical protein